MTLVAAPTNRRPRRALAARARVRVDRMTDAQPSIEWLRREVTDSHTEPHLARDRRAALRAGRPMPDRVHGAALFADVSGSTAVAELLASELGPHRGAEELTACFDRLFHAVIGELDRFGGDVIYFSGDAVTCWLDGDDGTRAVACALAMQEASARAGDVVTPAGTVVNLAIKIAIAVGPARRFVVGDPSIRLMDVLAGSIVDELAAVEQHAAAGEVVVGPSARRSLADRVELAERSVAETGLAVGIVAGLNVPVADALVGDPEPPLPEELVRPWLLPVVYERLRAGRGAFLAELRQAIPMFVRFAGIDYDHDDDAADELDEFVRRAQRVLAGFGGNVLHMTLGDKGAYLYAIFGAPHAHEDDARRAVAAALALHALDGASRVGGIQTGISTGRVWSGVFGHTLRREFTCLGDAANLAARLMSAAPPGGVYVSAATRDQAGDVFAWERLDGLRVKGKADPVVAYRLLGPAGRGPSLHQRHLPDLVDLVGRHAELEALAAALDVARGGHSRVVGIAAEAGVGKSRLVAELASVARASGHLVALGACEAFGANANYAAWRDIWRVLLDVDGQAPDDEQRAQLTRRLASIDPTLPARAPLLQALLDVSIPDTELTAALDPKLRKASLEDLLGRCLQARAAEEPLVIVLEDCHWIEPLSRDLLEALVRATADQRVLFVLTYRPAGEPGGGLGLAGLPRFTELPLTELAPADAERLIRLRFAQLFGPGTALPDPLLELVTTRAQGNPFYAEELLSYVRSRGIDVIDAVGLREMDVPESLQSLILSRIDTLGESPRLTLKVASVIGRAFTAPALVGACPELGTLDDVRADLDVLRSVDLVTLDQPGGQAYLFRHVVTQDVTYESLPFSVRAILHEHVGSYIEAAEPDAVERNLDLLAHHYWHSSNAAKQREFLLRAGAAAEARSANAAAIDYFERAASVVDEPERVDVLLRLGKVLELTGDWQLAEDAERDALALARRVGDDRARARCETALAEQARRHGRYDEAETLLAAAASAFAAGADDAGLGQVHHLAGTLAAQQGDYDRAVERYEASLAIRQRLGDRTSIASILSNLGIVAEYRGEYELSRDYHERALALREEIGDRRGIAVSLTNLGTIAVHQHDYADARGCFEHAMRLNREVGDSWMVAISHNNLGNALRGLGDHDAARGHYALSLSAYRRCGDNWAMAYLLEDIAQLAAKLAEPERALELVGAADTLRDEIGAPRAPALERQLEAQLAASTARIGPDDRAAWRRLGRALGTGEAFDMALAFCEQDDD